MTVFASEKQEAIHRAADLVRGAKYMTVLTGAGFSTPSGIPDFRSVGSGLWTRYLPMEVASLSSFRYCPEKFFAWLRPLASHMFSALPNAAHVAVARLEQAGYVKAVITQNIDGLHTRAGSKNVLEIHGTFNTLTCIYCYCQFKSDGFIGPYIQDGTIPLCPNCQHILKPDVILYEEQLPTNIWHKAKHVSKSSDLMLVAGTSLEVMPSAGLPMRAIENGAHLILVNRTETYLDVRADVLISDDVADIIPRIAEEILGA
jgi:NAD-dependent deacetylase